MAFNGQNFELKSEILQDTYQLISVSKAYAYTNNVRGDQLGINYEIFLDGIFEKLVVLVKDISPVISAEDLEKHKGTRVKFSDLATRASYYNNRWGVKATADKVELVQVSAKSNNQTK